MPGWHEKTRELQKTGKLQLVGIIEEQHPDRARLFMQWKEMPWPLLVDSLNLLEVEAVPITALIDEYGVVRKVRPTDEDLRVFLATDYTRPDSYEEKPAAPGKAALPAAAEETRSSSADALFLWAGDSRMEEAIAAYERMLELRPGDGSTHFRLGVALRRRFDSSFRQKDDFQRAIRHWSRALQIDPNQYIWRRRIQQYGPRLDKPYPFYDWVPAARTEIKQRGEEPVSLEIEPGGAEFAQPEKEFAVSTAALTEPDPQGRIFRDEDPLIQVEIVAVPATAGNSPVLRFHIALRPNLALKAHWNNEVDPLVVWVQAPSGWRVDQPMLSVANPPQAVSQETRVVEFELRGSPGENGTATIPAYALYYVCEDVDGTCLYRRQDISLPVDVRGRLTVRQ